MTNVFLPQVSALEWFVPSLFLSRTCKMQTNNLSSTTSGHLVWEDVLRAPSLPDMAYSHDTCQEEFNKDEFSPINGSDPASEGNSPNVFFDYDMTNAVNNFTNATEFCGQFDGNSSHLTPRIIHNVNEDNNCGQTFLPRQTSLIVAQEVLGSLTESGAVLEGFDSITPSSDHLDGNFPQHTFASRNQITSDKQPFSPTHVPDHGKLPGTKVTFYLYDDSVASCDNNETDAEPSNNASCEGTSTTCSSTTIASSTASSSTATTQAQADDTPRLQSLSSFIIQSIEKPSVPECSDSFDMDGILQEFLESAAKAPQNQEKTDTNRLQQHVAVDHTYSAKPVTTADPSIATTSSSSKKRHPSPETSPVSEVVDLTETTPTTSTSAPKLVRTPSYIKRRNENNRACRESRRKRKAQREEAEAKLKYFIKDNEEQKKKIKQLEKEVKEARALLVTKMTKKASSA